MLAGDTETEIGGLSVTVADDDFVASTTLVALTVTVCALLIVAGAAYTPADDTLPTFGLMDHVTEVFDVFCTAAAKG